MEKVSSWRELTLREKIGQTVICMCEEDTHIACCGSVEAFLKKYPIGGMFNNSHLVRGLLTGEHGGFAEVLARYNQHLRVPLIGTADRGAYAARVGVAPVPQMALGAADSEEMAYQMGEFMAMDCRLSGVHWLFWPVCDLNICPDSPVTNIRAVGDDPVLTRKIVSAQMQAMEDLGIVSTLKHYPGTPYDEAIDQHLAPVGNTTPMELWDRTYGAMYRSLIQQGAPAIMTSHINLESYQTEKENGVYPPATLSYELTTKLLRQELGFQGVTVTDALVMAGFRGEGAVDNMVRSFLAGNDMLLWPAYEYIDRMEELILSGQVNEALLDAAVERIWNLKGKYGILGEKKMDAAVSKSYFESRAEMAAEACVTLIQDPGGLLPADPQKVKNILLVTVTPDLEQKKQLEQLGKAFEDMGFAVTLKHNISPEDGQQWQKDHDMCIFALCRTPHRPIGPLEFWAEEAVSVWASNTMDKKKLVVASFGSPYLYRYYRSSGVTYLNAYGCTGQLVRAVARAIFGQIPFRGKTPVRLK